MRKQKSFVAIETTRASYDRAMVVEETATTIKVSYRFFKRRKLVTKTDLIKKQDIISLRRFGSTNDASVIRSLPVPSYSKQQLTEEPINVLSKCTA